MDHSFSDEMLKFACDELDKQLTNAQLFNFVYEQNEELSEEEKKFLNVTD
jgi:hypothetical protein